jgi:hypothetical protein
MKLKVFINNLTSDGILVRPGRPEKDKTANREYFKEKYIGLRKTYSFPFSREWKNTIYYYNNNMMKTQNIANNNNINKVIRDYFSLSFKSRTIINIRRRKKAFLLRNILLSRADIKYTSTKVVIRLFSFNPRGKQAFFGKLIKCLRIIFRPIQVRMFKVLCKKLLIVKKAMLKEPLIKVDRNYITILKREQITTIFYQLNIYIRIYIFLINKYIFKQDYY